MEISHSQGVGLKPFPRDDQKPAGVSEKNLKSKEDLKSVLLEKRASKENINEKANREVSFFVFHQMISFLMKKIF
jgi:hypothetical protein